MTVIDMALKSEATGPAALLRDSSIEISAKDAEKITGAGLPAGTRVSITFMPNEDFPTRIACAAEVRRCGLVPVPHIAARRIASEADLDGFLAGLVREAQVQDVFVIAGDLSEPLGPYGDALAILQSGVLEKHGIRHVGISGYPEGHPDIGEAVLWQALRDKHATLSAKGLDYSIMTQFGFDAEPVLVWLAQLRREGVSAPVRIGVAGPASVKTLLRFAARCGVGTSAKVMKKYGLSITNLLGSAGPDPFLADLAAGLDPAVHGEVRLHFYPFGGVAKTAGWIAERR